MTKITLRQLSTLDEAHLLDKSFSDRYPWYKSSDYFVRCLAENAEGKRYTIIAFYEGILAGFCHLLYTSSYPHFKNENIPEINDLNVFPEFQRKKIASKMFDELERIASVNYQSIGLGVGLFGDYGNAQRMYSKRGYMMDGYGITYMNTYVQPGQSVVVDDELLIYLIKELDVC